MNENTSEKTPIKPNENIVTGPRDFLFDKFLFAQYKQQFLNINQ
jgi:hypothetical protein